MGRIDKHDRSFIPISKIILVYSQYGDSDTKHSFDKIEQQLLVVPTSRAEIGKTNVKRLTCYYKYCKQLIYIFENH